MTEQTHPSADSELIRWLLEDSGISRYRISKDTGVSETTLSRLNSGDIQLDSIRYGFAKALTGYARKTQDIQNVAKDAAEGSSST